MIQRNLDTTNFIMEQINMVRVDSGQKALEPDDEEYKGMHGAIYYGVSLGFTQLLDDVTGIIDDIDTGVVDTEDTVDDTYPN